MKKVISNKKLILLIIITILGIIGIITYVTYAYFSAKIVNNSSPFQVHGGILDLSISETPTGNTLLPVLDTSIDSSNYVFKNNFTVKRSTNSDDINSCYKVNLVIDEIGSSVNNRFVKYRLKQGTNIVSLGNFYNVNTGDKIELLPNQNLPTTNTTGNTYELTVWLSYDLSEEEAFIYEEEASSRVLRAHIETEARNKTCTLNNNTVTLNVVNGTASKTVISVDENDESSMHLLPNTGYSVLGATASCVSSTGKIDYQNLKISNITGNDTCTITLPEAEYKEIEYIESAGTQYIDTGYQTENTYNLSIIFSPNELTTEQDMGVTGSTPNWFSVHNGYVESFSNGKVAPVSIGNKYVLNYGFKDTSPKAFINVYDINNNLLGSLTHSLGPTTGKNIQLWKLGSYTGGIMKLYDFKLFDSTNTLIRHLIPVKRVSDNKPGMYDLVNNDIYFNQASGDDFNLGPDL